MSAPPGMVVEVSTEGDVDIAVVRQRTTRTSGYHTPVPQSRQILVAALQLAEAQRDQPRRRKKKRSPP